MGRQVSDEEREITALPVRYEGLGNKKPEDDCDPEYQACDPEYQASKDITKELKDSIILRYNWAIPDMPRICGCGKPSSIDHLLSCHLGGYTNMRHNRLRDLS